MDALLGEKYAAAYYFCGVAAADGVRRDGLARKQSRAADNGARTDCRAFQNQHVLPYPNVVADKDGFARIYALAAAAVVHKMRVCRADKNTEGKQPVVPDNYVLLFGRYERHFAVDIVAAPEKYAAVVVYGQIDIVRILACAQIAYRIAAVEENGGRAELDAVFNNKNIAGTVEYYF